MNKYTKPLWSDRHLLAAAPELYEIAKKLSEHAWAPDGQCLTKNSVLEVSQLIDALRKAVAKAEGKE